MCNAALELFYLIQLSGLSNFDLTPLCRSVSGRIVEILVQVWGVMVARLLSPAVKSAGKIAKHQHDGDADTGAECGFIAALQAVGFGQQFLNYDVGHGAGGQCQCAG